MTVSVAPASRDRKLSDVTPATCAEYVTARLPEDMVEADNKQSPIVRLSPHLLAHMRRWRDTKAIAQFVVEWDGAPVKSIKTGWKTALKLSGVQGKPSPHALRHTCVTWLKQDGWSSYDVGNFVGMRERMVEHVYGHYDPNFQSGIANSAGRKSRAASAKNVVSLPLSLPPASQPGETASKSL